VDREDHRRTAVETFNRCWELLENGDRTDEDNRDLLTLAFVSRYYWSCVGAEEQMIISDWMVSRAAATIGEAHLALRFAQCAYDHAQEAEVPDWLSASVCEGLARAHAANGDLALRNQWYETAADLIERIEDHESKALIAAQLDSVPRSPFGG
jgi:predicted lipid-binding transport protein (Tim44 family)